MDTAITEENSRRNPAAQRANLAADGAGAAILAGYAGMQLAGRLASRVDLWVIALLVSKPLVDLTWSLRFGELFHQEINAQTIVAVLALCLAVAAALQEGSRLQQDRVIFAFLLWAAAAVLVTPTGWGANELIRLYSGAVFYFIAVQAFSSEERFRKFAQAFLAVMLVPVLLSYGQALGLLPFSYWDWIEGESLGRASGLYRTPLELVRLLVFAVPLALWLRERTSRGSGSRRLATAFLLLAAPALAFTYHRIGWLVIALQVFLWLFFTKRMRYAAVFLACVMVCGALFSQRVEQLWAPVQSVIQGDVEVDSGQFLRGRGANWIVFFNSWYSSNPALWFIGKGGSIAEGFVPGFGEFESNEAHNDFIRILHAYGLVGLSLYLWILKRFWSKALAARRCAATVFGRDLGTILILVLVAVLILSLTTEPMRYPTCVSYLFTLAALVSSTPLTIRMRNAQAEPA